jgi:hypothetical protein
MRIFVFCMNRVHKTLAAVAACLTLMLVGSTAHADDPDSKPTEPSAEHFRAGALVGAGFPRPLSVGAFGMVDRTLGFGIEYGMLPRLNIAGAEVSMQAVTADVRLHPFKNAFFIGLAGGHQWLDMSASMSAGGFSGAHSLSATTWFINPRIGALHTFSNGITIGVDAGIQIPVASDTSVASTGVAANDADGQRTLRSAANTLGNGVTPTFDLLRIGFSF